MRLVLEKGSSPADLQAATTSLTPAGASIALLSGSLTRSSAQNAPTPRTSPTQACRSAIAASPGPKTSRPRRAAFSTMPSSRIVWIVATAAAQAGGGAGEGGPPGDGGGADRAPGSSPGSTPPRGAE